MTIRFGGGEFIQGNSTRVLQRLASLTTNQSRPFTYASKGDNNQTDFSTAIFLDGKDVDGVKAFQESLGAKAPTGFALLTRYLESIGLTQGPSGGIKSPKSDEWVRRIYLPDDAKSI